MESRETQAIKMTDTEKRLLSKVFPGEERVMSGNLFDYQEKALAHLRAEVEYLDKKYPDKTFQYLYFEPSNLFTRKTILSFCLKSGELTDADEEDRDLQRYRVEGTEEKDGFICRDTFYAAILGEPLDHLMEKAIAEEGISARVFSEYSMPAGEEISPQMELQNFGMKGKELLRVTRVYTECGRSESDIKTCLEERAFPGTYIVYFADILDDLAYLENRRSSLRHVIFRLPNDQAGGT